QRVAERCACGTGLGTDHQVDVRDFVAVTNQRLAEEKVGHVGQLPSTWRSPPGGAPAVEGRPERLRYRNREECENACGANDGVYPSHASSTSRHRRRLSIGSRPGEGRCSCAM